MFLGCWYEQWLLPNSIYEVQNIMKNEADTSYVELFPDWRTSSWQVIFELWQIAMYISII